MAVTCSALFITWCNKSIDKAENAAWDAKNAIVDGVEELVDDAKEDTNVPVAVIEGEVQEWDTIWVNYVWALQEDWSVFDTSLEDIAKANDIHNPMRPYEPLTFTVWAKQMIPWFDAWVVWMKLWEKKEIKIPAAEWYGERTDEAIQDIPKQVFTDAWTEPVVGEQYNFWIAPGTVLEIWDETVKLDFNHFLAWKDLMFEVTIEEITKPTIEEEGTEE